MKRRILGIPLIWLMVIGAASAAITGLYVYTYVNATGTYQSEIAKGFSISDGDTTDPITYQISGDDIFLSFPLYKNQGEGIGYTKVLKIVPDGTVTSLTFSNIQRTNNGITSALLGFYEENDSGIGYIDMTTTATFHTFPVLGNHVYYVDFVISTGNTTNLTDTITFRISK